MIKELNRDNGTNWSKKIQLELPLSDLQIIYDCIGAVPPSYLTARHKNTIFKHENKEFIKAIDDIYEDLDAILVEHNGITDNDFMLNTFVTLEMVGEEDE